MGADQNRCQGCMDRFARFSNGCFAFRNEEWDGPTLSSTDEVVIRAVCMPSLDRIRLDVPCRMSGGAW